MVTTQSDLLAQLHTAISGWTAEVGAAQQHLTRQIDSANAQLGRLLGVLQERNGYALKLAEAQEEIERLQQAARQGEMPPGTVTNYTPATDRARSVQGELHDTMERLQGAIESWTGEVTTSQHGLLDAFQNANTQLERLVHLLEGGSATKSGDAHAALEQVRHERDVLSDEVHALNIEVEAMRREQETFAAANLDAETAREARQRKELETLRAALVERDAFIDECEALLNDSQRIEASLTDEIAGLERQVALYAQSEEQLKAAVEQQRRESEQHIQALAGLTGELEALRRALAAKTDVPRGAGEGDVTIPHTAPEELDVARARIESLEMTVAALESAASRPAPEADAAVELQARVAELEGELASRPAVAELEALQEQISALEARPEQAELDASASRIAELESELAGRPEPPDRESDGGEPRSGGGLSVLERAGLEEAIARLEGELRGLEQREEESVSAARTLLQELETHREYEAAQEEALAGARAEADRLQTELNAQAQARHTSEAELAAKLEAEQAATGELRQSLEASEASRQALQAALDTAQAERASAAESASASDEERAKLQAALDSKSSALAEAETRLAALAEARDAAESRASALEAERDALRAESEANLAESRAAVESLTARQTSLEESLAARQQREAELLEERDEIASALHEVSAKKASQEEDLAAAVSSLEQQEQALADREGEIEVFRRDIADMSGQLKVLAEEERRAHARADELKASLDSVQAEKDALGEARSQQEAAMQATMAEVSEAIAERDELRDSLADSEAGARRLSAGEAGGGDASETHAQRARQQDILLSELTHGDERRSLGDILADAGVVTREQLDEALGVQAKDPSQLLGTILIENDYTTDDAIAQAVACQLKRPVVNPTEVQIEPQAIESLRGDICTWHVCIPLRVSDDRLVVAMANPLDESALAKLRDVSQREITPVVSPASQIIQAIEMYYGTF